MATLVMALVTVYGMSMLAMVALVSAWWLEGGLLRLAWGWIHGPDRTERANALVIGLYALLHALALGPLVAGLLATELAPLVPTLLGYAVMLSGVRVWGFSRMMRPLPARAVGPVARPRQLVQEHDGLRLVLPSRPVWPALLFLIPAMTLVGAHLLLAALWDLLPRPEVEVRIGASALCVRRAHTRRASLPLAGLRVHRFDAWDGTPMLRLAHADQQLDLPVGGAAPRDVAWLVRELQRRARRAPDLPESPEPPSDLRRLVRGAMSLA